jgi:hypothetical protein
MVTSPSGGGKTTLSTMYMSRFPKRVTEEGKCIPVLAATIPAPASVKGMVTSLLEALGDPIPDKGTTVTQTFRLYKLLRDCGVEMILLDEFQHIVDFDRLKILATAADWLKNLINNTNIPMVLMGIPGCDIILDTNVQLERRFSSRMMLEPFAFKTKPDQLEFRKFCKALDEKLPFDTRANLDSWETSFRIYWATGGVVGKVMALVRNAAELGIKSNVQNITFDQLAKAYEIKWGLANLMRFGKRIENPFETELKDLMEIPAPKIHDDNLLTRIESRRRGHGQARLGEILSTRNRSEPTYTE